MISSDSPEWRAADGVRTGPGTGSRRFYATEGYFLCDTDEWFPSSIGKEVTTNLIDAGVDTRFLEVHSRHGHYATTEEPEKWVPEAERFLQKLNS